MPACPNPATLKVRAITFSRTTTADANAAKAKREAREARKAWNTGLSIAARVSK